MQIEIQTGTMGLHRFLGVARTPNVQPSYYICKVARNLGDQKAVVKDRLKRGATITMLVMGFDNGLCYNCVKKGYFWKVRAFVEFIDGLRFNSNRLTVEFLVRS